MKIIRDGIEIELTSDELFNAYLEQESLFDIENIENNMAYYLNEEEYEKLKDNRDFIESAAYELRHNQDKHNMDFEFAIRDAFQDTKEKYLKKSLDENILEASQRSRNSDKHHEMPKSVDFSRS